jgi:hypothetical protein
MQCKDGNLFFRVACLSFPFTLPYFVPFILLSIRPLVQNGSGLFVALVHSALRLFKAISGSPFGVSRFSFADKQTTSVFV